VLPQVAQAALAIECRTDDEDLRTRLAGIEHAATRRCVDAERAVLAELGGDCSLPAAAFATLDGAVLSIEGRLLSPDGATLLRRTGTDGAAVARHLLDHGGTELLGR
jgi:hydroxymethylbilane synthase